METSVGQHPAGTGAVHRCIGIFGIIFAFAGLAGTGGEERSGQTAYRGPYLGQEPPGDHAVLFAPRLFVRENETHDTPWVSVKVIERLRPV